MTKVVVYRRYLRSSVSCNISCTSIGCVDREPAESVKHVGKDDLEGVGSFQFRISRGSIDVIGESKTSGARACTRLSPFLKHRVRKRRTDGEINNVNRGKQIFGA